MPKFQLNSHQIRNLMVIVLLTSVVAVPVFAQPLGLAAAYASSTTEANTFPAQTEPSDSGALTGSTDIEDYYNLEQPNRGVDDEDVTPDSEATDGVEPESAATDPVFETVYYDLYVSSSTLNMRAAPSTDAAIVTKLGFAEKILCVGLGEGWVKIEFNGIFGYVAAEYTSTTYVFQDVNQTMYVNSSTLNLRQEPSTDSTIVKKLTRSTKLTRTGIGGNWSRVTLTTGESGYVATEYLTKNAPVVRPTTTASNGATYSGDAGKIVDLAYSALGVRYYHTGSSMSGFDCSGLTSWCYRQIGISIPGSTSGYYSLGVGVDYANMAPGDIICMDTKSYDGITSITHVGIYVGGGNMIHASSSNKKVVIQNVSQYLGWGVKLIGIRRILN